MRTMGAIATCILVCAPLARAQVSPASRAGRFLEIFTKSDANGKALAFDVLDPADDPLLLKACFRILDHPHPQVMNAACTFLSSARGKKTLDWFVKRGLGSSKVHVRYACVASLGVGEGRPEMLESVIGHLQDDSWLVRCAALDVLSRFRVEEAFRPMADRSSDEDPRVRVEAMAALEEINDLAYSTEVIAALSDSCWPVRSAAVAAVRKLRPRAAFGPMIERLDQEKGRLKSEVHEVLVYMAGRDLGKDPEAWRDWWNPRAKRGGVKGRMDPEYSRYVVKPKPDTTRKFFSVPTDAKRVLFVLDVSASMNKFGKPLRPIEGVKPGETVSRYRILREELVLTLGNFKEADSFNVILFSTGVRSWRDSIQRASAGAKKGAVSFLQSKPPGGETNLFDGLARAFGVSKKALSTGRGYFEEISGGGSKAAIDQGPEVIFLLSDGVPNQGLITDPEKIVEEITRANRVRRIVIHSIAVGRFHADFLRTLAVATGGTAVTVGEGGVR
ncbi:MAG: HEAT repeat domain-containing protein [Planctomycetota bacterium]|jgi:hypothetical protein